MKIQSVALEQKSDLGAAVASLPWLPEVVGDVVESETVQQKATILEDGYQEQEVEQEGEGELSTTDDAVEDPTKHIPGPVWENNRSKVVRRCGRVDGSTAAR